MSLVMGVFQLFKSTHKVRVNYMNINMITVVYATMHIVTATYVQTLCEDQYMYYMLPTT